MTRVAGHEFDANGHCTVPMPNGEVCPTRLSWIRSCIDESCVGLPWVAHQGLLNHSEVEEIRAYVAAEAERCHMATMGVSNGTGYATSNPIEVVLGDEFA